MDVPPKPWSFFFTRGGSFRCTNPPAALAALVPVHYGSVGLLRGRASRRRRADSVPAPVGARSSTVGGVAQCARGTEHGRQVKTSGRRPCAAGDEAFCQGGHGCDGAGDGNGTVGTRTAGLVETEDTKIVRDQTDGFTQHFIGSPGPCFGAEFSEEEEDVDGWTLSPRRRRTVSLGSVRSL